MEHPHTSMYIACSKRFSFVATLLVSLVLFVFVCAPSIAKADIGPVAHWMMDDGSGNTATDSSGNGNNADINGTATWVGGKIDGALSFNGSDNFARVATFNNPPASTMTLCSWIKTSATNQTFMTFSRNPNSIINEGVFRILSSGAVQFWDYSNNSVGGFPYSGSGSSRTVTDGHWHMACFVKDGTAGTYYIDGSQSGTVTASVDVTYGNYDWVIGSDYRDHTYFNGLLDDVRVYNRALYPDEIASLYGLVGYWKFDDGSGSTAMDSSGNGKDGTLHNSPSWVTGKINGALQFNGTDSYVEIADDPLFEQSAAITVSAWVYASNFSQSTMMVTKNPVNTDWQLFLETGPSAEGAGGIKWRSGSGVPGIVAPFPTAGQWHLVTVTQTGTSASMYIDGTEAASGTVGALGTSPGTVNIGRFENDFYFNGIIDDVRIYNRGLLPEEVASLGVVLPTKVTGLSASGTYAGGFYLTWNANTVDDNITDYRIQYSTDSGSSWTTVDPTSTSTSYTLTGGLPGDYLFRVAAVNVFGQGDPSDQVEVDSQAATYTLGSSCADLEDIDNTPGDVYGHYVMSSDIDCSGIPNFSPIDFSGGFKGTFNGQGHSISNLTIDASSTQKVGLFTHSIDGSVFENLHLSGGSVVGSAEVGALVGHAEHTTINSVISDLDVFGIDFGVGGLVGEADSVTIASSSVSGDVSGAGYGYGGLVGYVNDLTLHHSFATGNVTGGQAVGGLIGDATGDGDGGGLNASECFASGNISGGDNVGGIVGQLTPGDSIGASITNCYATGNISKNLNVSDDYSNFGGLAGYAGGAEIRNSYYAGSISGAYNIGGLIGELYYTSIYDSFSAASITADTSPAGAVVGADNGLNGFDGGDVPPLNDVVYDASQFTECDGSQSGLSDNCTAVNTSGSPAPTYFFNNTSNAPFSNDGPVWDFSSIWYTHGSLYPTFQNVGPDVYAPSISEVEATPAQVSSTILWTTDEVGSSRVVYSPDTSYASSTSVTNTSPRVTSHSVVIPNLVSCTNYLYKVISTDASSNTSTSTAHTFTTSGCAGNATVSSATTTSVMASGGGSTSLTSGDTTFAVTAPSNFTATSSSVVIQIKTLDSSTVLGSLGKPSSSLNSVGSIVFDVKALIDSQTTLDSFDLPVTITYHYTDADISGLDESTLLLYHYHSGVWSALNSCSVNASANTITCTAPSFSIFSLFGQTATVSTPAPSSSSSGGGGGGSGGTHFGCTDSKALNYESFAASNPALCKYATKIATATATLCTSQTYPTKSIKFGSRNDPVQVKLLEQYLNTYEHAQLPVDGIYSKQDRSAVIAWQEKYPSEILTPWHLAKGTGYIYKTSLNKFKSLFLSQCQKSPSSASLNSASNQ